MQNTRSHNVEWPTILLAGIIYASWAGLTFFHARLPLPFLVVLGGAVIAWHMSLQHETMHGHPTRLRWLNDAIGGVPLTLWLPYGAYRRSHLRHHRSEHLTDPLEDPESYYAEPARLARTSQAMQRVLVFNNTLVGRLAVGPALSISSFLRGEAGRVLSGDRAARGDWLGHVAAVLPVLAWLHFACHLGLGLYLAAFVYPGAAIGLLRSFAEHRAEADHTRRTAVVERGGVFSVLFLFNNLHVVHHERPGIPWYKLPAAWRAAEGRIRGLGGPVYRSYGEVARLYWRRPHHDPAWPHD